MAWEFWIDRGGTFTDIVAKDPEGNIETHKLLSENPEHYKDAAVQAISNTLGHVAIDQADISVVKMGTTVATNALLDQPENIPDFLQACVQKHGIWLLRVRCASCTKSQQPTTQPVSFMGACNSKTPYTTYLLCLFLLNSMRPGCLWSSSFLRQSPWAMATCSTMLHSHSHSNLQEP